MQLGLAVLFGRLQAAQELILQVPNGVNTRIEGGSLHTSLLSFAALGTHVEVCEWLLQAGADVDSINEAMGVACVAGVSGTLSGMRLARVQFAHKMLRVSA